jgi:hypothetical protein
MKYILTFSLALPFPKPGIRGGPGIGYASARQAIPPCSWRYLFFDLELFNTLPLIDLD